jgi:hypothetical protein
MVTPLPATLAALAGTRYGPVAFEEGDGGLTAQFDGTSALIAPDGGPLLILASAPCADAPDPDVATRIRGGLSELAAARPDLCTLTTAPAEHTVVARWWVAQGAGPAELAATVRSAVLLARVGTAVVDAVLRDAATAAAYRRAESEASRAADEAERALQRLLDGAAGSGTGSAAGSGAASAAGSPGPTPPAPSAPVPTAPAPPTHRAPIPAPTTPTAGPAPTTCVANQPAQVLGGGDHAAIGVLHPGATYQVLGTAQGWVHVRGEGLEGWAPATAVQPAG